MEEYNAHLPLDPLTLREFDVLLLMGQGLSNREIAHELDITVQTARWYCKQIYSKLDVHTRAKAIVRANELGLLTETAGVDEDTITFVSHNVPLKLTPLIGRASAIAGITEILIASRFVTLTGPPGTGKTRLALHIARKLIETYKHGVYFIELAPISDPNLVAQTIASALSLRITGQNEIESVLKNYLRKKDILLVLDNFEQVIECATLIGELLSSAQYLNILITSRQALQIYGEHEYIVSPLSLPELDSHLSTDALAESEAIALFIQRVQAANSDFHLTDDNAPTVAKICIKLDGLPLAIELAAAQIKLFSPQALLSRLDDSLSVLKSNLRDGPERHASLLSAIEWSYNLLSESEQILLARLSVFLGGLSIEAVEAICWHEFEMDVLDGLGSLLNKGLLQLAENRVGEPRFFFLETIHDFARDRLRESNEADKIQHLHAEHFARWVEYAEPYTASGSEQLRWMQRLETEHDNLRAALRWSLGSDNHELGQRIVGALTKFWDWRGYHREWEAWLKRAWVDIEEAPKPVRASLVYSAGFYALNRQSAQEAIQYFLEAEQIYRELDNKSKYARTLMDRSVLLSIQPEGYQEAKRLAETACALLREIDERPLLGHALNLMGIMEHLQGNLDDAHQILEEALVLTRETGDHLCECLVLGNLGEVLCDERDYTKAEQLQTAGLKLAQEIDYKYQIAYPLKVFADIATGRGQIERAAQLLGATTAAFEEIGTRILPLDQLLYDQLADNLRERLGTKKFEAMWSKGRTMTLEESVALVLPK